MNTDKLTTYWGVLGAAGVAAITFLNLGVDLKNPSWWAGLVTAIAIAVKSYYTNKPSG